MDGAPTKTILLVEDEVIIAMDEARIIEGFGFRVLTAGSGEKAVELARGDAAIALVLMDIDLGRGIDGTEAARRILAARTVPIVFVTSHSEREMVEKVRGITRYGYMVKNAGSFVLQSSIEMAFELFEAHERTKGKEAELAAIYENAPIVMLLLDGERRVRKANGRALQFAGRTLPEVIGLRSGEALRCLNSIDSPEGCGAGPACANCAVRETALETLRDGESRYNVAARLPFLAGGKREELDFLLSTKLLRVAEAPLVLVSLMDITERTRAEAGLRRLNQELELRVRERTADLERTNAELRDLDRLRSMFVASMSHELRTPLTSVLGFASILREGWVGPITPEQEEDLSAIHRSGRLLLSLINNVIDASELEAGTIEARYEPFDLHALLEEAARCVECEARAKGLRMRLRIHRQDLRSDRRRLLQCVVNLLLNAVKFTAKGEILLSSERRAADGDPRPVAVTVRDTGPGIAAADLARLFQPFARLDAGGAARAAGPGLGLYLTRRLAEDILRGEVACESAVGAGSAFTLRIPERVDG